MKKVREHDILHHVIELDRQNQNRAEFLLERHIKMASSDAKVERT